jgi:hypothetical protein
MKSLKRVAMIVTALSIVGLLVGSYLNARAQQNVVGYLQQRFQQLDLPVTNVRITKEFPLEVEVTIRTAGSRLRGTPADPITFHLVRREIILARQDGYFIDTFSVVFIDPGGHEASRSVTGVQPIAYLWLDSTPSQIPDEDVAALLRDGIELYGLSLVNMEVFSAEGLQSATMEVAAASLEVANAALPRFMPSLQALVDGINTAGAHIVSLRLQVRDEQGELLLDYIRDLRIRSQNAWMREDITLDWFPHPPAEP